MYGLHNYLNNKDIELNYRNELPDFLINKNCIFRGLEVGTYVGFYAKTILDNWPGHLYCVDVWKELSKNEYPFLIIESLTELIAETFNNLKGLEDRCTLIRSKSVKASEMFYDNFFDFIYIDANHDYKFVKEDLECWWPKLRSGGIFCGHDFIGDWNPNFVNENGNVHVYIGERYMGEYGVNKAVLEFCETNNLNFKVTKEYWGTWYLVKP
jgi:hypothetical protein